MSISNSTLNRSLSETRALILVSTQPARSLNADDIYKASILAANSGQTFSLESGLSCHAIALLDARRSLSRGDAEGAKKIFAKLANQDLSPLLTGDLSFLEGVEAHRAARLSEAQNHFLKSISHFETANEMHRSMRALINAEICVGDSVSYTSGSLYALEKRASVESFFDLLGNICKARAIEQCIAGRFQEARMSAKDAVEAYSKDSCPEDLSVALAILASVEWMLGQKLSAAENRHRIRIESPKVKSYIEIFEALVAGRRPKLNPSHPLAKTPWLITELKEASVTGRIIAQLRLAPTSRDDLILAVWPNEIWSPQLTARLYSAITHLRKSLKVSIGFDGQKYFLE